VARLVETGIRLSQHRKDLLMISKHDECGRPIALLAERAGSDVDGFPLYALRCAECGHVVAHEHSAIVIDANAINGDVWGTSIR
jgi:hypothetical protein